MAAAVMDSHVKAARLCASLWKLHGDKFELEVILLSCAMNSAKLASPVMT